MRGVTQVDSDEQFLCTVTLLDESLTITDVIVLHALLVSGHTTEVELVQSSLVHMWQRRDCTENSSEQNHAQHSTHISFTSVTL